MGLFFTNKSCTDVVRWFRDYSEQDYARAGFLATDDVTLKEGPLAKFPHSMEPYLRQLGMPTALKKGGREERWVGRGWAGRWAGRQAGRETDRQADTDSWGC